MTLSPATAQSALGLIAIPLIAWALSEYRANVRIRLVAYSLAIQLALALMLTRLPWSQHFFSAVNSGFLALDNATRAGTSFVFGYLGGANLPFQLTPDTSSFVLAFQALPLIIVLSSLTSLLTHLRILPFVINAIATVLNRFLAISAPAAFASAANIFVGMVESPLFIKPYLSSLSRSELFVVMTVGMSTIAGTVMVVYVGFLQTSLDGAAGHLLAASIISIPAAIGIALTMVPMVDDTQATSNQAPLATTGHAVPSATELEFDRPHNSAMDALVSGTQDGLKLCLQIAALLVVFVALITLLNGILTSILPEISGKPLSLERLLGSVMIPLVWLIGIPWSETQVAAELLGTKLVLNEFIALRALGEITPNELSERSIVILSYALSGFANIGSLGILIGGLTTMAPSRREEIISLAPKAIISGTLSTLMTGAIIGLLI